MSKAKLYDLLVDKSMDPVSVLGPKGITNDNKYDIAKLASILASFGDFKDKKSRLKIRKDQSEQIQAIAYLMRQAVADSELISLKSKRKADARSNSESESELITGVSRDERVQKRCKTFDSGDSISEFFHTSSHAAQSSPTSAAHSDVATETAKESRAHDSPHLSVHFLPAKAQYELEAALTLQDLSNHGARIPTETPFRWNQPDMPDMLIAEDRDRAVDASSQVPALPSAHNGDVADSPMLSSEVRKDISSSRFMLLEDWLLDEKLGKIIKGLLVTISNTADALNKWCDGRFEGKIGRILAQQNTGNSQTSFAVVRLLEDASRDDDGQPEDDGVVKLEVPVRFLIPHLPEKSGDEVVVVRVPSEKEQECAEIRGTCWRVRALGVDIDDSGGNECSELEDGEVLDLVELESELGQMLFPRACLARYSL